jgi:hypothetical protein
MKQTACLNSFFPASFVPIDKKVPNLSFIKSKCFIACIPKKKNHNVIGFNHKAIKNSSLKNLGKSNEMLLG